MKTHVLKLLLLVVLHFNALEVFAQQKETYSDVWFFMGNKLNISEKWSISNELHIRRTHFLKHWEQLLVRPAVNYKLNKTVDFSIGYSFLQTYPFTSYMKPFPVKEHNVWEQIQLHHKVSIVKFSHRLRFEQRFNEQFAEDTAHQYQEDGYLFSNRIRYRFTLKIPFAKKFFFKAFNEIMIRMNKNFRKPDFDRNWLYGGFGYQFSKSGNIQIGYLNQLIKITPDLFQFHPTVVIGMTYNFTIKKDKKT